MESYGTYYSVWLRLLNIALVRGTHVLVCICGSLIPRPFSTSLSEYATDPIQRQALKEFPALSKYEEYIYGQSHAHLFVWKYMLKNTYVYTYIRPTYV